MNVVSPPPAPSRTRLRPDLIRRLARRWIPLGLLILAWLCLLVRLTVRDGYIWSAALFYMGPWPVLFAAWPVLADLGPWPLTPQLERTERIRQLAGREPRTLVVGDFNTPYDSVAFDRWRYQWFHGLSQSTRTPGAATWPVGLPLLSIDHVWLSKDLWPRQAWKETVLGFDHAWQIIEFSPFLP